MDAPFPWRLGPHRRALPLALLTSVVAVVATVGFVHNPSLSGLGPLVGIVWFAAAVLSLASTRVTVYQDAITLRRGWRVTRVELADLTEIVESTFLGATQTLTFRTANDEVSVDRAAVVALDRLTALARSHHTYRAAPVTLLQVAWLLLSGPVALVCPVVASDRRP